MESVRDGNTSFTRYTRQEIEKAWHTHGQGSHQARCMTGTFCVLQDCTHEQAIELAALFVRLVFAIPTCTYFNGQTLCLYIGDAGSGWKFTKERTHTLLDLYNEGGIDLAMRELAQGGDYQLFAKEEPDANDLP